MTGKSVSTIAKSDTQINVIYASSLLEEFSEDDQKRFIEVFHELKHGGFEEVCKEGRGTLYVDSLKDSLGVETYGCEVLNSYKIHQLFVVDVPGYHPNNFYFDYDNNALTLIGIGHQNGKRIIPLDKVKKNKSYQRPGRVLRSFYP